jgi:hypothetical protein
MVGHLDREVLEEVRRPQRLKSLSIVCATLSSYGTKMPCDGRLTRFLSWIVKLVRFRYRSSTTALAREALLEDPHERRGPGRRQRRGLSDLTTAGSFVNGFGLRLRPRRARREADER